MSTSSSIAPARDEEIYSAIQQEHAEWKRLLFDEYAGLVRGLLIRAVGPQAEVDDLSAEVFQGLFESAKNIRSADGMRSYIVSVTMNTARREFRRRKRRASLFFRDDGGELVDRAPGNDDPKAKAALLQLTRILDDLSTEERLVFALHVLEELPLGQVAESLAISLSTAKRRLKRAQQRVHRRVVKNPLLADYVRDKAGGDDD
jgi:RNA polymerase sigma-70 factor (ECF subfamily)